MAALGGQGGLLAAASLPLPPGKQPDVAGLHVSSCETHAGRLLVPAGSASVFSQVHITCISFCCLHTMGPPGSPGSSPAGPSPAGSPSWLVLGVGGLGVLLLVLVPMTYLVAFGAAGVVLLAALKGGKVRAARAAVLSRQPAAAAAASLRARAMHAARPWCSCLHGAAGAAATTAAAATAPVILPCVCGAGAATHRRGCCGQRPGTGGARQCCRASTGRELQCGRRQVPRAWRLMRMSS